MSTLATESEAEAQKADAPRPRPRLLAGRSPRDLLGRAAVHLLLAVALVTVAFPVYYAIAGAFMGPSELSSYPPALVPHSVTGRNFSGAVDTIPLFRQYANSAITATAITVAQLFTSILAAYAFVFLPLKARAVVFGVFLATLMVPWEAIIIPNYLTLSDWGFGNTYFGLVLPFLASGFGTFMLRQAFRQLPGELRDAARIDGAGHWRFLWRIVVPLNKPALAALSIYVFLSAWNQYFWPLIITRTADMQTLQIGLTSLRDSEMADPGLILAGVVLSLLPTLALVVFGQRFIVRGLTAGAVR
ncbi:carbohydrate ABC transporter permease [Kitasatospora aureofaciens]|uniref:Glycerol-3-phosphate ABC transporter permease n=1 Tax=Kitasatospora aureofaciens TaxID=1894 RepID=A0A8H9LV21_KITAU|nr:carbohydrate ABC transporter permease [Kitasatospora aureofaciens]QEV03075.1 carbohydrate ABC transporter permease [Streptomyces viridifaciens]UKZ09723.1 carbohydrate ABC transporter permease [Streptomyces viridifaciens]GGU88998.1 glycerol-3-phosphate ABC transporter permease [Kitasatospora aureofaciens]